MFGKKGYKKSVENRLKAIKCAEPVKFSTQHKETLKKKRKVDREEERRSVYKFGLIHTRSGEEARCVVRDISEHGARIMLEGAMPLPAKFRLVIDGYPAPTRASLKWQIENEAGVRLE